MRALMVVPFSIGIRLNLETAAWLQARAAQEDIPLSVMARKILERAAAADLALAKDGTGDE